jgi:succinate dehydrogenase / fumarate reductase cytochrome b subunit
MLAMGAVAFTYWLVSIAAGPDYYLAVAGWLRSPLGLLLLLVWSFCFFFHLCNGLRHLAWDLGYGFDIGQMRASGFSVVGATLLLTVAFWAFALSSGAS